MLVTAQVARVRRRRASPYAVRCPWSVRRVASGREGEAAGGPRLITLCWSATVRRAGFVSPVRHGGARRRVVRCVREPGEQGPDERERRAQRTDQRRSAISCAAGADSRTSRHSAGSPRRSSQPTASAASRWPSSMGSDGSSACERRRVGGGRGHRPSRCRPVRRSRRRRPGRSRAGPSDPARRAAPSEPARCRARRSACRAQADRGPVRQPAGAAVAAPRHGGAGAGPRPNSACRASCPTARARRSPAASVPARRAAPRPRRPRRSRDAQRPQRDGGAGGQRCARPRTARHRPR